MDNQTEAGQDQAPENPSDFKRFATKRMAVVIVLFIALLWVTATVAGWVSDRKTQPAPSAHVTSQEAHATTGTPAAHETATAAHTTGDHTPAGEASHVQAPAPAAAHDAGAEPHASADHQQPEAAAHGPASHADEGQTAAAPQAHAPATHTAAKASAPSHPVAAHSVAGEHGAAQGAPSVKGVAFVDAVIKTMHHELYDRFWGWRPNDIIDFTDNVNNYQLGVLEVTRRTAVTLAERISRAGSTESFDKNLENAMNWFMVSADRYWFPSPEGKYKDGLKELAIYRDRLKRGEARFWTRTDNLIPLLVAYEDLLGSCDENLVKAKEDDGTEVSFFAADDYFFYAKGVASALYEILHAIEKDFYPTIEARRGIEVLHHAIESCHHAIEIDPIVITNSSLSGILANHRANMAAPISHARFYLSVLIKTLST